VRDPTPLRHRVRLTPAVLKEATAYIVEHHYLHRGRRMAQVPYWVNLDDERVGVILFSLPRISVPFYGYPPMQLLELARLWLEPRVQGQVIKSSTGGSHVRAIAGCAVAQALRCVRSDWTTKYPNLPPPRACVAWADLSLHSGTVYRATNFRAVGVSGGRLPGAWTRPNGGAHHRHEDYLRPKVAYLYAWTPPDIDVSEALKLG
jgi:hypothetical protein